MADAEHVPTREPAFWALIPAAGIGRRMGSNRPKQYLTLGSHTILSHTLSIFLEHPRIRGVVLVLGPDVDPDALDLPLAGGRLFRAAGGAERADSVQNGLDFLAERAHEDDWVLVHDAARPCLPLADVDRLLHELRDDPVGGLLASPSTDTIKWSDGAGKVERTLDRERVWRALTPQMFRLGMLRTANAQARAEGHPVTDEASAIEFLGQAPRLIEGSPMNIKITRSEDLELARLYLMQQGRLEGGFRA
ncbi:MULTISPECIES: 2-C-methyl-D-erythritol 4-phosphate cytidylyltransferase [Thioalkalivibrio]|uniref:2-C-methyl-D-erythritol 4-phosphate cytidylyltransferase n=1 Tax=Thioalkalivibrio versutus TaxID=106634 RepID=A0A0G3G1U8_9GAMM|nr:MULTISPECIES: 2-C-methyl-D-erythritol 4-phosphate cytidylyltransferase [Thioalkalivibrio]AKJ95150.1 2-C-methyl-D-erythritol 4-phosphate cytidylyltransferase [Thioalkalivibrio versutus]